MLTRERESQNYSMRQLAVSIENIWKCHLNTSKYSLPNNLGYIEGRLEGAKLTIENHCFKATQFRKLHLELAHSENGLDILHCVMFPNPKYLLPIFGMDLVGIQGQSISAAIVDLSPINGSPSLPEQYQRKISLLPKLKFSQSRSLPDWGDVFSDSCLFIRPINVQEEIQFIDRVKELLLIHCAISKSESPLSSKIDITKAIGKQNKYCIKQRQNKKTLKILEKSFGVEWAHQYINTVLFDFVDK